LLHAEKAPCRPLLPGFPPDVGEAAGAEPLHVLMLPDFERADRIGESRGHPETRSFGELLIDLEEDKVAKTVVIGLLAEMERGRWASTSSLARAPLARSTCASPVPAPPARSSP
jgi:hypothetical protein